VQRSFRFYLPYIHIVFLALYLPGKLRAISEEEFFQAAMIDDHVQGQLTASGVRYDREHLVVTHPYLPFGTRIQITNLENEQTAEAEVVDRPHPVFHTIGLSAAVAQRLCIPPLTPVEVSVTRIETPLAHTPPSAGHTIAVSYRPSSSFPAASTALNTPRSSNFRLQFGSFADPSNANLMQQSLNALGIPSAVSIAPGGKHFRVLSQSTYEDSAQAQSVASLMVQRGLIREAVAVK
jgi:rare lipoprotein A